MRTRIRAYCPEKSCAYNTEIIVTVDHFSAFVLAEAYNRERGTACPECGKLLSYYPFIVVGDPYDSGEE